MLILLAVTSGGEAAVISGKFYDIGAYASKIGDFYTTEEVSNMTGYNRRYLTQLCRAGRFVGAYKVETCRGWSLWRIPAAFLRYTGPRGHYQYKIITHRRIFF